MGRDKNYIPVDRELPVSGQPALGRKFIYVIGFNTELGHPSYPKTNIPFYVGQTDNLNRRFANHAQLIWHKAKFDCPAMVWIADSVPELKANSAEEDLIRRLSKAGFLLTNVQTPTKKWRPKDLFEMSRPEILHVIRQKPKSSTPIINEWKAIWRNLESKSGNFQEVIESISQEDIKNYFDENVFRARDSTLLSRLLATLYNPELGGAEVSFDYSGDNPSAEMLRITKMVVGMKGTWGSRNHIQLHTPVLFHLTKAGKKAIADKKIRSKYEAK